MNSDESQMWEWVLVGMRGERELIKRKIFHHDGQGRLGRGGGLRGGAGGGERRMSDGRHSRYGSDNSRGLNYLTGANSTRIQHNRGRANTISNPTNSSAPPTTSATTTAMTTNSKDRRGGGGAPLAQNLRRTALIDSSPAVLLPVEDDGEVSMEEEMIYQNLEIEKDKRSELPSSDEEGGEEEEKEVGEEEEEVITNMSDNMEGNMNNGRKTRTKKRGRSDQSKSPPQSQLKKSAQEI